jgi:hypothetical protein
MNKNYFRLAAFVAAGFLLFVPTAKATVVNFDFETTGGPNPFSIIGSLIVPNNNNNNPVNILSISGLVFGPNTLMGGTPISGLVPNPNPPNAVGSPDGNYLFNNVGYGGNPHFDLFGLLFTAGAYEYNIYSLIAPGSRPDTLIDGYQLSTTNPGGILYLENPEFPNQQPGTLFAQEVSAVPELSTWAMMLFGFAGVGFVAYRRAKKSALAIS